MEYKNLFTPMKIGKCEIKNRIVMSPMLMGFGKVDGKATEAMMDYYEERAKGGTGLIITEVTRINDRNGAAAFAQLGVSHDYQIEPLKEMANRIHSHDAKLFVQLHHPGRQNVGLLVGTVPMCIALDKIFPFFIKMLYKITPTLGKKLIDKNIVPSSVAPSKVEPSYFAGGHVRALSHKEIKKLIQQFIDGAERVQKAGCDGVELHASHGYLLQQFLSPNTNKRKDEYGGSLENRMRFILEIIEGIRIRCGEDFPIIVRLTVDECYDKIGMPEKGYGLEEGVLMAKRLEEAGIDAIDVSCASYDTFNYWLEPMSFDLGWRKYMAKAVKEAVNIPVIAANLIRSPIQAEKQIAEGCQDFISLGRPHIADPYWTKKVQEGRENEIKRCICCLYCIESMQDNAYIGGHAQCSVNPWVGREKEFNNLPKNGDNRKVVIVGAGPAGLTCGEILARRGFLVTILEKENKAGGQLNLADKTPNKDKIDWCTADLLSNLKLLGVEIIYNTEADVSLIESYSPYAVIIATGGNSIIPHIDGYDKANVFTTTDVLKGKTKLENKQVAVIGSGMTGLETAELIATQGNKVMVIEMAKQIAPNTWMQHRDDILPKLKELGVDILTSKKLIKINDDSIELLDMENNKQSIIKVDSVILALGVKPVSDLYEKIKEKISNVYLIGDAKKVGRIANATNFARNMAIKL
jgi:2,4-dienoyl-CoA reductase-like NADH-dependent reductase (Old Yellow Enzyme family)/thioredoxin reductase